MPTIYDFPTDWYEMLVSPGRYRIRPMNQIAKRPWISGMVPKGPISQAWLADQAFRPTADPQRNDISAFFARLRGTQGVFRLPDASRPAPWYDRSIVLATGKFSDGTIFTDGRGFVSGLLPPQVYVATAAARGTRFLTLGGFPVSTANIIRRGDLFEVWPNGVPAGFPHLYQAMYGGSSDSTGKVAFDIEPGLRAGVAVSDVVNLRYASSVFRLADDSQGEMETSDGYLYSSGFTAIEAMDLVP